MPRSLPRYSVHSDRTIKSQKCCHDTISWAFVLISITSIIDTGIRRYFVVACRESLCSVGWGHSFYKTTSCTCLWELLLNRWSDCFISFIFCWYQTKQSLSIFNICTKRKTVLFRSACDFLLNVLQHLNKTYNTDVPLVLMNSFNTDEDTKKILQKYTHHRVKIHTFNQSR